LRQECLSQPLNGNTPYMKNNAPEIIHKLVETFDKNIDEYHSSKNETELRREFLDKFFAELGWDVSNEKGYDESHKEVVHEFSVEVAGQGKKADYAFRTGAGKFDFLVEAKKPSVKIESSQDAAFQLRRYGWSAKLPVNILTDFEHFAVYDCRSKPNYKDKASFGRIMLIHYKDYVERWDEIASVFSPEAVRQGSFAKYSEGMKGKKGTAAVDDSFLQEIERWRELLARNIALRNTDIDIAGLNYSVQMTIDRIVFLRICEERDIEPENNLLNIANQEGVYADLCQLFKQADIKFNSGLFNFKKEKEIISAPDDLTLSLNIDDKILKDIISNLYYPKSPYAFLYIPSDILGQVYERFLGKVIRLTAGHQAKVEEKPEVRKAGGVYYTPTYIVDYIVNNTIGKLVKNKKPKDVSSLKIVDPACGSGTFLLGAYQFLLDWHLNWYANSQNNPDKWVKNSTLVKIGDGYRLSTAKKKEILINNIHGVDIDSQAVEVTKLSLLLKVLENPIGQLELGLERVLPDLGNNIKCGNSLIGFDFFEGQFFPDEVARERVNPFEWKDEFKDIFTRGGFDVVIGNPPYVRQEGLGELKDYFQKTYTTYHGMADLYVYFIERGVLLLRQDGMFSFIVANKWFRTKYAEPLRKWLKNQNIDEIIDFGDLQVFKDVTTYPCIIRIKKNKASTHFMSAQISTLDFLDLNESVNESSFKVNQEMLLDKGWSLSDEKTQALLAQIMRQGIPLGRYINEKNFYGIKTGFNNAFVINKSKMEKLVSDEPKNSELIKPLLIGRNIKRYEPLYPEAYLILIPKGWTRKNSKGVKNAWGWFSNNYPAIANHLLPFIDDAKKRYDQGEYWWELRGCDYYEEFEKPKIIYPNICKKPEFTLEFDNGYTNQKCFIIPKNDKYLLGILNSSLCFFMFRMILPKLRGDFYEPSYIYFKDFPIYPIDFSDPVDKSQHDKMVILVNQMLAAHKSMTEAQTPQDKAKMERQIEFTDRAIDLLVYELYGLNEEEIRIVEDVH